MENLGAILILLSMLGFIIAPIGLIKGNIKTLRIANRKQAGFLLLGCFVFFIIGGVMVGPGEDSTPAIESDGVAQIEQIDVALDICAALIPHSLAYSLIDLFPFAISSCSANFFLSNIIMCPSFYCNLSMKLHFIPLILSYLILLTAVNIFLKK